MGVENVGPATECAAPPIWLHLRLLCGASTVADRAAALLSTHPPGVPGNAMVEVERAQVALRAAIRALCAVPGVGPAAACPRCLAPLLLAVHDHALERWIAVCESEACTAYLMLFVVSATGAVLAEIE